jgi:hypothetical protein
MMIPDTACGGEVEAGRRSLLSAGAPRNAPGAGHNELDIALQLLLCLRPKYPCTACRGVQGGKPLLIRLRLGYLGSLASPGGLSRSVALSG